MNKQDGPTAADVLNTYDEATRQRVFSEFGEVRNARTLALAAVRFREQKAFGTTADLVELCSKNLMGDRMRYLSQVFQSLRMEFNEELAAL